MITPRAVSHALHFYFSQRGRQIQDEMGARDNLFLYFLIFVRFLLLKCCSRADILQSEQRKTPGKKEPETKNRREDKLMLLCGICAACLVGIMVVYVTVL